APGLVAPAGRIPRTAMALDGGQGGLRSLGALPLGELPHVEPRDLVREVMKAAMISAAVARHVQGRRRPENLLDGPGLQPHHCAGGQERVPQHAMPPDRVPPEDPRELRSAAPTCQHEPPRVGLDHATLTAAASASAGAAPEIHLVPGTTIAADALELATGCRE